MARRPLQAAEDGARTIRQSTLKAVIFDLDGVVADSHPIHEIAWTQLLVERGLDRAKLDLDFLYAGHPRRTILKHYLGEINPSAIAALERRKDELYKELASQLRPKPGIPETLHQLGESGIICALATSAGRARTHATLERIGLRKYFAAVVTGEEAGTPKPAPEIFLLAAARIETPPESCVVVEDSVAGVSAARAAGMKCVAYAPVKRFAELADAGANDLVSELPEDATGYFKSLLEPPIAKVQEPAAGARR